MRDPAGFTVTGAQRAVTSFRYTAFGEVEEVTECADGALFSTTYQYDALGRNSLVRYPVVSTSQLAVGVPLHEPWSPVLPDRRFNGLLAALAGKGDECPQPGDRRADAERRRDGVDPQPVDGLAAGSTATAHADNNTVIQNWSYGFDEIGNLRSRARADAVSGRDVLARRSRTT